MTYNSKWNLKKGNKKKRKITIAGAIEAITVYVQKTWHCPVVFFTSPKFEDEKYNQMVDLLQQIAQKHDITIIDMLNDAAFNDISEDQRTLYMADHIHPTRAGYLEWWAPYFEKALCNVISQ